MSKKSYSDYPTSFLSILDHFSSSDEPIEYELPYRQAASTRHQLYRFIHAIYHAAEAGDEYAMRLADVARRLSISATPGKAPATHPTKLTIYVNPLEVGKHPLEERGDEAGEPTLDVDEIERIIAERGES